MSSLRRAAFLRSQPTRRVHVLFRVLIVGLLGLASADGSLKALRKDTGYGSARPTVFYGVMTNNLPAFQEKLLSQLETWAAGAVSAGNFVALTGTGNGRPLDDPTVHVTSCNDTLTGVTCKEERLLEIGYEKGVDWLMVLGEDNYVDTSLIEARLANESTSQPLVLGLVGDRPPRGEQDMERPEADFCPEMSKQLFGGGGYALNRAALERLFIDGREKVRSEYMQSSWTLYGDLSTSCALHKRGIDFNDLWGLVGIRIMSEQQLKALTKKSPFTYHYMTPSAMRWLHALLQDRPVEDISALAEEAFIRGCCCSDRVKQSDLELCYRYEAHFGHRTEV